MRQENHKGMAVKILLTNTYNWQNMGEVTQVEALIRGLPEATFIVSSIYSFIDRDMARKLGVRIIGADAPKGRLSVILKLPIILARQLRGFWDCDMVVDLGGDTFSDDPSPVYTLMHSIALLLAWAVGKPYVICSQSVGPFKTRITRWLAIFLLSRARSITVRGQSSFDYLTCGLRLTYPRVQLAPDLAFLVPPAKVRRDGAIGLNPSQIVGHWMEDGVYIPAMADVVSNLRPLQVRLIPHVLGPDNGLGAVSSCDDRRAIGAIRSKLPKLGEPYVEVGTGLTPEELRAEIARCRVFVGARMHSCIASIRAGVPTLVLAYSEKSLDLPRMVNGAVPLEVVDVRAKGESQLAAELLAAIHRLGALRSPKHTDTVGQAAQAHIDAIRVAYRAEHEKLIGPYRACYVGRATDEETWSRGASGGVTTALLEEAKRSGMVDSHLTGPQGSHYTLSDNPAVVAIRSIWRGKRYVVVSLPCQTRRLQNLRILGGVGAPSPLVLGLFCAHRVEEEGVRLLLKAKGLGPDNMVTFRVKRGERSVLAACDDEKGIYIPQSEWWGKYLNYAFIPKGCLSCHDLCNEQADVSLGDAHHIRPHANLVIVRTEAGERLVESAIGSGVVQLEQIAPSEVVRSQRYIRVKKAPDMRARGYKMLRGLGNRVSHSRLKFVWRLYVWRVKSD